ncbi:MAG: acetoin reductase [Desulfovibrio sp.]|nr:acetoin reductase [Desulfovibrio sp.]
MSINGKIAVVTGSAQGIGRGIALRLAQDGADICLVDMQLEKLQGVAEEIRKLGRKACAFQCDVTNRSQVFAAVDYAEKELGGFDIIVNNAGICITKPLEKISEEECERIFKINVFGVLWGIQAAAAKLKANKKKGKIISACSIAGHTAWAMLGMYSSTKFAVRGLTQAAAQELAPFGINVNSYCPGIVDTNMWTEIDQGFASEKGVATGETWKASVAGIALGRAEKPEDVAAFVSYLAGPDSDYMTGQSVLIDGGIVYN